MITRSQQLSNNFHFPDVATWKKIEKRYKDGALHYAVPLLFHHRIISSIDVAKVISLHDETAKSWKYDIRRMTVAQGKLLHQILEAGYNSNMDNALNIRFYE
eukprot:11506555-Karenia_brevis.AAC.1